MEQSERCVGIRYGNRSNRSQHVRNGQDWPAINIYGSYWDGRTLGDGSWAASTGFGSSQFLFIEDNTFTHSDANQKELQIPTEEGDLLSGTTIFSTALYPITALKAQDARAAAEQWKSIIIHLPGLILTGS